MRLGMKECGKLALLKKYSYTLSLKIPNASDSSELSNEVLDVYNSRGCKVTGCKSLSASVSCTSA